jgi:hypothetical protein
VSLPIVQGFERWQAGEPVNPSKSDVVPKKPLTRQEKQRKAERADAEYAAQQAAKMEAHVRTVERSWGASRMDEQACAFRVYSDTKASNPVSQSSLLNRGYTTLAGDIYIQK